MSGTTFYQQIEALDKSLPALESWNPPLSGEMDCVIRRDGSWQIDGSALVNERLLRLFSTVLKHEEDNYYLVTPVEKWRIEVEDLPFLVVELDIDDAGSERQVIRARTNVGDRVTVNAEHPLSASPIRGLDDKQSIPCVTVRAGLLARFNRNTHLELAKLLQALPEADQYRVSSAGSSFTLCL